MMAQVIDGPSPYRPYYDPVTFQSPSIQVGPNVSGPGNGYEFLDDLDIESGVAALHQSKVAAVAVTAGRFYARMAVAQPFEVVKFLLQVSEYDHPLEEAYGAYEDEFTDDSSDEEEVDYFVDTANNGKFLPPPPRSKPKAKKQHKRKVTRIGMELVPLNVTNPSSPYPEAVTPTSASVFEMMGALMSREGFLGLWRGMHSSCLYKAAYDLLEAWFTGFFTSLALTPNADPQYVDVMQSSNPLLSVAVATAAGSVAVAILAPVAMIRARLLVTSFASAGREPRSLRYWLLNVRSLVVPSVLLPSVLSEALTKFVRMCTPVVLFRQLDIDEFRNPQLWPLASLCVNLVTLLVKLPLDTMANRASVMAVRPPEYALIVPVKVYRGMIPTIWSVLRGEDPVASLYRGWRVELMGTLGEWGYDILDDVRPKPEHF